MANAPGATGGTDLNKLYGGVQGGSLAGTLATLVIYVLDLRNIQVPPEIAVAIASLFTVLLSAAGTYLRPHTPAS